MTGLLGHGGFHIIKNNYYFEFCEFVRGFVSIAKNAGLLSGCARVHECRTGVKGRTHDGRMVGYSDTMAWCLVSFAQSCTLTLKKRYPKNPCYSKNRSKIPKQTTRVSVTHMWSKRQTRTAVNSANSARIKKKVFNEASRKQPQLSSCSSLFPVSQSSGNLSAVFLNICYFFLVLQNSPLNMLKAVVLAAAVRRCPSR